MSMSDDDGLSTWVETLRSSMEEARSGRGGSVRRVSDPGPVLRCPGCGSVLPAGGLLCPPCADQWRKRHEEDL